MVLGTPQPKLVVVVALVVVVVVVARHIKVIETHRGLTLVLPIKVIGTYRGLLLVLPVKVIGTATSTPYQGDRDCH